MKDRKTFSINSFRGLDTENKPVLVHQSRATDGQNFYIDGGVMKTRPSFSLDNALPFDLETGEKLISWYQYGLVVLYVTSKHFYIVDGLVVFNEKNFAPGTMTTSLSATNLDFNGKTPLFQEEKSALFIFGLGDIYVFAVLSTDSGDSKHYVLYTLGEKPSSLLNVNSSFLTKYEDLPTPYAPLLILDGKAFEDVNLLSKTSRYGLFVESKEDDPNKQNKYELPTHFDLTKNGGFEKKVTFYKDSYNGYDRFAIFLGVVGEHLSSAEKTACGEPLSSTENIMVTDVYTCSRDFVYDNAGTPKILDRIVGITKNEFFALRVENTLNTTFESAMLYIKNPTATLDSNKNYTICFKLPIRYKKIVKDVTTGFIVSTSLETETVDVYVQLCKFISMTFIESGYDVKSASLFGATDAVPTYPSFPSFGTPYNLNWTLNSLTPINFGTSSVLETFKSLFSKKISDDILSITSGNVVQISGYFYKPVEVMKVEPVLDQINQGDGEYGVVNMNVDLNDTNDYPEFDYQPEGEFDYYDTVPLFIRATDQEIFWDDQYGLTIIRNRILELIASRELSYTTTKLIGIYRVHIYSAYDDGYGTWKNAMASIAFRIGYASAHTVMGEDRYSIRAQATVTKESVALMKDGFVNPNAYRFEFNESNNCFDFYIFNGFYDYRNKPSIDIEVKFTKNPDYDLIAKMKFGTNFGVEGRLFLAGHEDYPHIDRYNVSNDLLGDGVANQSYELSYFPSKNYRVVGGKTSSINGYVVATDNTLYVSKTQSPQDSSLFVRTRKLNEDGSISYFEYKTSIQKSPLNNRCIIRYYNDILMLTKDGLFAIELSENVLSDERLLKLRSGFVNTTLKTLLASATKSDVFVLEDNERMYLFIGDKIFYSDNRLIDTNDRGMIGNVSYEMVKWISSHSWVFGKIENETLKLLDSARNVVYKTAVASYDSKMTKYPSVISFVNVVSPLTVDSFSMNGTIADFADIVAHPENYSFYLDNCYRLIASTEQSDYTYVSSTDYTINEPSAFYGISDGDTLYTDYLDSRTSFTIGGLATSNMQSFTAPIGISKIYKNVSNVRLFVHTMFVFHNTQYFRLSDIKPETINKLTQAVGESDEDYLTRVNSVSELHHFFGFGSSGMKTLLLDKETPIACSWVGSITDFGNHLFEKTSFTVNVYATRRETSSIPTFGYKTVRKLNYGVVRNIDMSSSFDFSETTFDNIALSAFNEIGMSFPMKENNFLYMQFFANWTGLFELNAIEIIYKNNRLLKSVG